MRVPEWSVVTVTYNSRSDLERHWVGKKGDRRFRWIVVDNGSTDGTLEVAEVEADLLIHSGGNLGFSAANNLGLSAVDTEHVLFANPDLEVPNAGWQDLLAMTAEHCGGLVAPQLVNPDGSLQPNARGIPFASAKLLHRLAPRNARVSRYAQTNLSTPTYCAWVMGAAVGGRTTTVRALGGWDQSYFLYYEDHDLGLRAWANSVPVVLEPRVRFVHDWARATKRLNLWAWRAEIVSMARFYRTYPELAVRSIFARRRRERWGRLCSRLWEPVREMPEAPTL